MGEICDWKKRKRVMTDLIDLIEAAEHAERLAKRQRELVLTESAAISADLYVLRTWPVIEVTLGLGNDCSARQIGITRAVEKIESTRLRK
jgi:hypothetical protein